MKCFSGLSAKTPQHLQMDAGAFLRNYDVETDTFATAKATKLLGATVGGGSFSAVPTIRRIEVDGAKGAVKGLETVDEWVVTMTANVKEITVDALKTALAASEATSIDTPAGYTKITGKCNIALEDYLDNLTWVGRLSGSEDPVIIVVKNVLGTNGLTLSFADKAEGVIPVTVTGHYTMDDLETPPFEIYYPSVE